MTHTSCINDAIVFIVIFTNVTMVITAISIIFTVYVINVHYRSADVALPKWVSRVVFGAYLLILSFCANI